MKHVREKLSGEERKAWRAIESFEEERPSTASAALKVAAAPLQAMVPASVTQAMHKALGSLVDIVQKASEWDVSPERTLRNSPYQDLQQLHDEGRIEHLRELCGQHTGPAVLRATLQGAGLGMGGVMLAVADVPLLLVSHLRLLCQVGMCCGYDLRGPGERGFLLGLLKLSYCLSDWEEKRTSLAELEAIITRHAGSAGDADEVARTVLFRSIGAFSDKIAPILLRRRAGTMIPLLGSAIGAGCNYLLTQDVARAGRSTLIKRFLVDRASRR